MRERWLDSWAGFCYKIARHFARAEEWWRNLGDRAYREWERLNRHG